MRHGSNYAVHNRGPPCKAYANPEEEGDAPPSLFSQANYEAVGTKVKGSNGRCDPTVRAL